MQKSNRGRAQDSFRFTHWGGEFADRDYEAAFRAERLEETLRHGRILFALSAVLNALFLFSDWRFYGTDQFWIAVPARIAVVAVSLAAWGLLYRVRTFASAEGVMVFYMAGVGLGVGALVSSHSDIAFLVVVILPAIFYLGVPASFRVIVACGAACSTVMLTGYLAFVPVPPTTLGLALILLMLNVALSIVVSRSNRLRRLEWSATRTERDLREKLAENRLMLETMFMAVPMPLAVVRLADGRAIRLNQAAAAFFGEDLGSGGATSVENIYGDPELRQNLAQRVAEDGQIVEIEATLRRADGKTCEVSILAAPIEIAGDDCLITTIFDISRHKEIASDLERLATTDALTGLANRSRFFAAANLEIARAASKHLPVSILMADLDDFKMTNDQFGHEAGDMALKAFAEVCLRTLRSSDVVARLGGEEFAILVPGANADAARTLAEIIRLETEVLRPKGAPEAMRMSVSIGLAEVASGEDAVFALARADRALYAAKRSGRNRVMSAGDPEEQPALSIVA